MAVVWLRDLGMDEEARVRTALQGRYPVRTLSRFAQAGLDDIVVIPQRSRRTSQPQVIWRRGLERGQFLTEVDEAFAQISHAPAETFHVQGQHTLVNRLREQIQILAETPRCPVLLIGETGTGKNLVARELHRLSERRDAVFVEVNCSALAESLFESELFGHVRGAFTGADVHRIGLIEQAEGGTLFIDEINSLSMGLQTKLLTFLESKTYRRVGETEIRHADVRLVFASNEPLEPAIAERRFRQDLFYRISVASLQLPALRHIATDIPILAQYLLDHTCDAFGRQPMTFSDEAVRKLLVHPWTGNVRELRNVVERAVVMSGRDARQVETEVLNLGPTAMYPVFRVTETLTLEELEQRYIEFQMSLHADLSLEALSERLGVCRKTLYSKRRAKTLPLAQSA